MALEIERKFLVKNDSFKNESFKIIKIKQGFLSSKKKRVVRVRITDETAFLTIKGISSKNGLSRYEWEREIPIDEANELFLLCEKNPIEKNRYLVKSGKFTYEIDDFLGKNKGLVVAEIELISEKDMFKKPLWLGKEVTGDSKYYNSELSKNPFKNWHQKTQNQ